MTCDRLQRGGYNTKDRALLLGSLLNIQTSSEILHGMDGKQNASKDANESVIAAYGDAEATVATDK